MRTLRNSGVLAVAVVALLALSSAGATKDDDDILTVPRLGEEYVVFRSGPAKSRASDDDLEERQESLSNSALLGVLTGSVLSPADTLPIVEVQTEVSVVTSKEVLVGGRPVAPRVEVEPMSDTGRRSVIDAEEEEMKILERKAKAGKKKAPSTAPVVPVPALVLGAAEGVGKAVEVVPEALKGVQSPKFVPKEGEIGVPPQKAIESTTTAPEAVPLTTLVPPLAFRGDIVAVNLLTDQTVGSSSGGIFGSPSSDKMSALESAASNQASRVNVKKGPDGQDYEYEYVYYYYEDDDKAGKGAAGKDGFEDADFEEDDDPKAPAKAPPSTTSTTSTTTTTTTTTSTTTEAPPPPAEPTRTRSRGRGGSGQRSKFLVKNSPAEDDSAESASLEEDYSAEAGVPDRSFGRQRGRGSPAGSSDGAEAGGRNRVRYTVIDRNRGAAEAAEASVGNRIRPAVQAIEEAVPASNEVGVSRGGPRYRNRNRDQPTAVPVEVIPEDRLPANTRFPPRGRGQIPAEDSSYATEPILRVPAATPASPPRGAVRPSLELVDSSSFRTNAGGASPDQDLAAPSFPAIPSGAPVKFLGVNAEGGEEGGEEVEEDPASAYPDGRRTRPRTEPAAVPTTPAAPSLDASAHPTYSHDSDFDTVSSTLPAAVEKSVFDLYAILQAQDNASNLVSTEEGEEVSSAADGATTPGEEDEAATTTAQPTTTTTTTEATTTTTTTTTTPAPTTEKSNGRPSRFRGRGNAGSQASGPGRNRYRRPDSSPTSSTTEAPSSEAPVRTRGRFSPSRTPGNGAAGASRGSYGRRSTTTAAPTHSDDDSTHEEEKPATRQFSRLPLNRTPGNRFRGRGQVSTSTTEASALSEGGSPSSPSLLARPTFADRYNLRRRGQTTTTTQAPSAEDSEEGEAAVDAAEASPAPQPEVPSRLPGRPRVRPPGSLAPRPLRPGPRLNLPGRTRPGLAPLPQTSSTAAAEDPSDVAQEEAASENHSAAEEHIESEDGEDKPGVTTPIPGPLTRLRNRPRLRVTEKVSTTRPAPASSAGRRQLVSSLLPRRRPGQASTAAPAAPADAEGHQEGEDHEEGAEEHHKEEVAEGEEEPTTPATSTTAHEERGLAGLLAGRKRSRRPGTLFPGRPAPTPNHQDA